MLCSSRSEGSEKFTLFPSGRWAERHFRRSATRHFSLLFLSIIFFFSLLFPLYVYNFRNVTYHLTGILCFSSSFFFICLFTSLSCIVKAWNMWSFFFLFFLYVCCFRAFLELGWITNSTPVVLEVVVTSLSCLPFLTYAVLLICSVIQF